MNCSAYIFMLIVYLYLLYVLLFFLDNIFFFFIIHVIFFFFFFSSRRRHTRSKRDGVQTCALPILSAPAEEDIVLRGMGSFHIGGRIAEVSGKPVTEIQRVPGGPMSKLDRNGQFMVEQMYVQ